MAMSAEPDDAPDWLVQKPRRRRPIALIACLAIGGLAFGFCSGLRGPLLHQVEGCATAGGEHDSKRRARVPLRFHLVEPAIERRLA